MEQTDYRSKNQQLFDRDMVQDLITATVGHYLKDIAGYKKVCFQRIFKFVNENFDNILKEVLEVLNADNDDGS